MVILSPAARFRFGTDRLAEPCAFSDFRAPSFVHWRQARTGLTETIIPRIGNSLILEPAVAGIVHDTTGARWRAARLTFDLDSKSQSGFHRLVAGILPFSNRESFL